MSNQPKYSDNAKIAPLVQEIALSYNEMMSDSVIRKQNCNRWLQKKLAFKLPATVKELGVIQGRCGIIRKFKGDLCRLFRF